MVCIKLNGIEAADAEEAVAAIRAGQTRVVGKRTPLRFFYREHCAVDMPDCEEEGEERGEGVDVAIA
jgi:hypothetical protein